MKTLIKNIFSVTNEVNHKVIRILGLKIKFKKKITVKNVYVGCGDDYKPGYVGCDIRKSKNVKYVCKAWEISKKVCNLDNIYSRHMCEHLTFDEFRYTLKDWYNSLAPAGVIHIIVPNLDFHIKQFMDAKKDNASINNPKSDINWALAGLWGWQRESYIKNTKATKYWDVHKSGYNEKLMRLFLEEAGFFHITFEIIDDIHLSVMARKPVPHDFALNSGERQISSKLEDIRLDHINRYDLAINSIKNNLDVSKCLSGLDIFCGTGYGSYLVSQSMDTLIDAIDGSEDAISIANSNYKNENTYFEHKLFPFELPQKKYDYIISLESIEHIKDYSLYLSELYNSLKENGILILSTPNSDKLNLIKNYNPFHYRHYKNNEIIELLNSFNFELLEIHGQDCYKIDSNDYVIGVLDSNDMKIKKNYNGQFTICVFRKNKEI